jgi:hypothetical protein
MPAGEPFKTTIIVINISVFGSLEGLKKACRKVLRMLRK